ARPLPPAAALMRRVLAALALAASATAAQGGAWTLKQGHWQLFSTVTQSQASVSFDAQGRGIVPTKFDKLLVQNTFEYGLTGAITLFATAGYADGTIRTPFVPLTKARDTSFEGGARLALYAKGGRLSLQTSYKAAGAFDLSTSAGGAAGRQVELRLLYGTGFKLFGRDGFADVQVAQRWIEAPRPNETPLDLTVGLWLNRKIMVMAQSFNTISAGDAAARYTYYRTHKFELSVVQKLSRHWSLQTGAFYSPAGQNALVEKGVIVSLWTQD
ncbi:MAG TPA: hypothetical protein VGC36_13540, partial [Rhizomicrobium sp.]